MFDDLLTKLSIDNDLSKLEEEARKHNNTNDFIDNLIFRGETGRDVETGTSMSRNIEVSELFTESSHTNIVSVYKLKENAKILDASKWNSETKYIDAKDIYKYATENGYDAIDYSNDKRQYGQLGFEKGEEEVNILNINAVEKLADNVFGLDLKEFHSDITKPKQEQQRSYQKGPRQGEFYIDEKGNKVYRKNSIRYKYHKVVVANLTEHAQREMELAGLFDEDADYDGMLAEAVMELIQTFADQGHSGFSAGLAIELFKELASYNNLTDITDNPEEWNNIYEEYGDVQDDAKSVWQNRRKSTCFSSDGGKTYYDIDEGGGPEAENRKMYDAEPHKKKAMKIGYGKEGLDHTMQSEFPEETTCDCGGIARIAYVAQEEVNDKQHTCDMHPNDPSGMSYWVHDLVSVATYFCKKCLKPVSLYNQG